MGEGDGQSVLMENPVSMRDLQFCVCLCVFFWGGSTVSTPKSFVFVRCRGLKVQEAIDWATGTHPPKQALPFPFHSLFGQIALEGWRPKFLLVVL